jgi:hypothetical protein
LFSALALCFVALVVMASVVVFEMRATTISVTKPVSLTSSAPTSFAAYGGDTMNWTWSAHNSGNSDNNALIRVVLNETSLTSGEARITIYDQVGSVIGQTSTANGTGVMDITSTQHTYAIGETFGGNVVVDLNTSADPSNYSLRVEAVVGTYTFTP